MFLRVWAWVVTGLDGPILKKYVLIHTLPVAQYWCASSSFLQEPNPGRRDPPPPPSSHPILPPGELCFWSTPTSQSPLRQYSLAPRVAVLFAHIAGDAWRRSNEQVSEWQSLPGSWISSGLFYPVRIRYVCRQLLTNGLAKTQNKFSFRLEFHVRMLDWEMQMVSFCLWAQLKGVARMMIHLCMLLILKPFLDISLLHFP